MNADGSGRRLLTAGVRFGPPAWSPDGQGSPSQRLAAPKPGHLRHERRWERGAEADAHRGGRPVPSGRRTGGRSPSLTTGRRQATTEIYVMNADGSGQRRLTSKRRDGPCLVARLGRDRLRSFATDGEIYVMNADGSGQRNLTGQDGRRYEPPLPSGRRTGGRSPSSASPAACFEIYAMNADGNGLRKLTRNPTDDGDPAWSPDGRKIAFASVRDGNQEIYVMNADGSGQQRLTRNTDRRRRSCLVAGRAEDRLREPPRRRLTRSTS